MQTLTFEKGITTLTREELARTIDWEQARGSRPKTQPVPHFELLNAIINKANTIPGITVEEEPIHATERQTLRIGHTGNKDECPLEKYLINRLTTRIHLKHESDTDMNMAIGLSYNDKGIVLAFGPNVWVCSNQNVFGDNIMRTYGGDDRKVPFDKMMEVLNAWIERFDTIREQDYALVGAMKNTFVEESAMQLMYGKLIDAAVLQNINTKEKAPLNQTEVADFIRASHSDEYKVEDRALTVWDLQQRATSILKPAKTDIINIFDTNNTFNNFLAKEFPLTKEAAVEVVEESFPEEN